MHPKNETIQLSHKEAVDIFRELELIVVSLHKIGARYMDVARRREYEIETTRFIDDWRVTERLANVRKILATNFHLELGDDEMDDLERACLDIDYWEDKNSLPQS